MEATIIVTHMQQFLKNSISFSNTIYNMTHLGEMNVSKNIFDSLDYIPKHEIKDLSELVPLI